MKTLLVIPVLALAGAALPARADPLPVDVRQRVIRAPEMEVVRLLTGPGKTDAERVAALKKAVAEGHATVVSDVSSAADESGRVSVKSGQLAWMPSELDQRMEILHLVPTAFEERFLGTALECRTQVSGEPPAATSILADWVTRYAPREPATVKWPTSWLDVYDLKTQKPTGQAIHGWLDWRDTFEERLRGRTRFTAAGAKILGVVPPGDQVWPGHGRDRWLDVFLAEAQVPGWQKTPATAANAAAPESPCTWVYGIALDARQAVGLMRGRKAGEDADLLQELLARVEKGAARLQVCAGSAHDPNVRSEVLSARWHEFPTEMPSIPSAWDERAVGTVLEMDAEALSLRQALAPPGRSEWKLAQDIPEIIMWQPRFRDFLVQTLSDPAPGVRLLAVMQVPEVMQGEGVPKDETLLVFCHREGAASPESPPAKSGYEAEILVFEIPAAEEADWQAAAAGAWTQPDTRRLRTLLDRAQSGESPAVAHGLVQLVAGYVGTLSLTEDYPTATEFDPPENTPRMRPTALEALPVGSRWQVELNDANLAVKDDPHLLVTQTFSHSTTRPVEPGLKETLAIAARSQGDYPGAVHLQETWDEAGIKTVPGLVRCLGLRKPPGIERDVRHVAFFQVRKL